MSDDEGARRAPEPNPTTEPAPALVAPNGAVADAASEGASEGATAAGPASSDADAPAAGQVATGTSAGPPAAGPAESVGSAPQIPPALVAFLKEHAVTLVLIVLLIAAVVWGALGVVSTNEWKARAAGFASDLASAKQTIAEAHATIDDLEIAKERAETTATACVGAIGDADAMLEVSAKMDDKTVVYLEGLNDFMAAVAAGNMSTAETIGAEIDALGAQLDDLSQQIEGHIDDYEDSSAGCHVDAAQDI
ncbi:hypothetical protein ACH47X_17980 [Promicromonospora kroppenstedtii]|uniref:Uncharacterized protein n=1 Tax=Promicromonospora kroppenstedtii TaxID=440482 RepID=A0ABW7XMP4_9MICO